MNTGNTTPHINSYGETDTNRFTNQPGRPVNRTGESRSHLTPRGRAMVGIATLAIGGAAAGLVVSEILPSNANPQIINPNTVPAGSVLPGGEFIPPAYPGNAQPNIANTPTSIELPKH